MAVGDWIDTKHGYLHDADYQANIALYTEKNHSSTLSRELFSWKVKENQM